MQNERHIRSRCRSWRRLLHWRRRRRLLCDSMYVQRTYIFTNIRPANGRDVYVQYDIIRRGEDCSRHTHDAHAKAEKVLSLVRSLCSSEIYVTHATAFGSCRNSPHRCRRFCNRANTHARAHTFRLVCVRLNAAAPDAKCSR